MSKKTGNSVFLKEYNRRQLLSLVRKQEDISYVELTKLSGLAPKSVYEICQGLIEDDFLYESAIGESGGGRKPKMLSIKPNSYFSIGIDIDVNYISAVLMDITGKICDETELKTDSILYDDYLSLICGTINKIIIKNKIDKKNLLGIGVSVPGFIDARTKHIVMAPNLHWEDKDIINDLKNMMSCEIYLENEALASTICEKWIGDCKLDEDFICINIKSGIGAGIFASDKPYRGTSGSAGEIGHIPLDENGPICGCKNRGCLETLASSNALVNNAKAVFGDDITLEKLIDYARNGDEKALLIFKNAAEYLGLAITFLVNTFNPSKIIIGKDFIKYAEFELHLIVDKVKRMALKSNAKAVVIKASKFGERSSVLGAAILPQRAIF
jgi:N-acetylglucosamine repressor